MLSDEYRQLDGLGLAALIKSGQISAREAREAAYRVIDERNPKINAVIARIDDLSDAILDAGPSAGPFQGVPFAVKDIGTHFANVPCECGSRFALGLKFNTDSTLAERYKRAGFVPIARTNTPEMAASASTEPLLHGPTHNPWCLENSPGGSSGGSAAAVAASMVPIAHGSDGGGSIRIPSALCGVFGFKPSRHRVPFGPDSDESFHGLNSEHVITRSVRDSAAVLDAVQGAEIGDRYLLSPPQSPYRTLVSIPPRRLKVAFTTSGLSGGPDPDASIRKAISNTARLCEELGHDVFEANVPASFDEVIRTFTVLAGGGVSSGIEAIASLTGRQPGSDTLEEASLAAYRYSKALPASALVKALAELNGIARRSGNFFAQCDVFLTATCAQSSFKLGVLNANAADITFEQWVENGWRLLATQTPLFNLLGLPAMSLPLEVRDDGMPVGVQFAGRFADEATLFQLAGQLEHARPWRGRSPKPI